MGKPNFSDEFKRDAVSQRSCHLWMAPALQGVNWVLSVRCETLSTWRSDHQSGATSADERLPLRQGGEA